MVTQTLVSLVAGHVIIFASRSLLNIIDSLQVFTVRFQCTCLQYQRGGYCLITDVLHCWATPLGSLFFLPEFRSMAPLVSWIRGPTLGSLSFVPALWDLFVNADVTSRGFRLWPGAGIRMLRGQGPPDLQAPDPSQPHIYPSPCGARLSQVLVVSGPRPLYLRGLPLTLTTSHLSGRKAHGFTGYWSVPRDLAVSMSGRSWRSVLEKR